VHERDKVHMYLIERGEHIVQKDRDVPVEVEGEVGGGGDQRARDHHKHAEKGVTVVGLEGRKGVESGDVDRGTDERGD
jgi:hypothetical protein